MAEESSHGNTPALLKNIDEESSTGSEGYDDDSNTPLDLSWCGGTSSCFITCCNFHNTAKAASGIAGSPRSSSWFRPFSTVLHSELDGPGVRHALAAFDVALSRNVSQPRIPELLLRR
ncbi:hypothetical protein HPB50_015302 [Hyalomma asiaticum]|uniref:Uncharacterized protein n=1 Tax=Hyalomma asiaticum TaxID=266040 RepID=A0ACB7RIZ8_HYAAI|nr:hypothetical protein HPB50_015302 [Hyalomma asiaticum]